VKLSHQQAAEAIVQALQEANFLALFAGGWVRDFVMGKPCNDIDIATSAHPEEVMRLFPHSVAVGAQFGVVRVFAYGHEFEIATFRSDAQYIDGRRPTHVHLHSSPQEDAQRRDFTINGLFYDPISHELYDYVGGREDIERKVIRTIGSPQDRFKEDRLRMIRAIRFKNTLSFTIESETWNAIVEECHHIPASVSKERIWQELQKMMQKKILAPSLSDMATCSLLATIFPILKNTPSTVINERIAMIQRCSGTSLVGALCLLFQGEETPFLGHLAEEYRLSRKEQKLIELFVQYKGLHTHLSDPQLVRLYAHSESEAYLAAVAAIRHDPEPFLQRHRLHQEELRFWIDQMRSKKFLITGKDMETKGIGPGTVMGQLLTRAFDLSIEQRLTDKEAIMKQLQI
jgi:tRNA nucleotidyltransferase/poly(A) polymerase